MWDILRVNGFTGLEKAGLILFLILFTWITGAFWTALFGFIIRLRGHDSKVISSAELAGKRHSELTQITPENVGNLALSWLFQTGQNGALKCTPLLVDGVLYITVPDNVWAVDARSAGQITAWLGDLDSNQD